MGLGFNWRVVDGSDEVLLLEVVGRLDSFLRHLDIFIDYKLLR
jgi:hypothetical protein